MSQSNVQMVTAFAMRAYEESYAATIAAIARGAEVRSDLKGRRLRSGDVRLHHRGHDILITSGPEDFEDRVFSNVEVIFREAGRWAALDAGRVSDAPLTVLFGYDHPVMLRDGLSWHVPLRSLP